MTDYQQHEEATPVIGPGICQEVADRMVGHTLLDDIDPMTIFPQVTPEDFEKLEGRVEGWYNLISQMGDLKIQIVKDIHSQRKSPVFFIDPYNRLGTLFVRIEQYLLLLASPGCTPELKAQYWAAVEEAKNNENEITPVITIKLTQLQLGENTFEVEVAQAGKPPDYVYKGTWESCLKWATQFYKVRRWECSGWKAIMLSGDPLSTEKPEGFGLAIGAVIDQQQNDLLLEA